MQDFNTQFKIFYKGLNTNTKTALQVDFLAFFPNTSQKTFYNRLHGNFDLVEETFLKKWLEEKGIDLSQKPENV